MSLFSLASLHTFYMRSRLESVNWAIRVAAVPMRKVSILLLLVEVTARRGAASRGPNSSRFSSSRLAPLPSSDAGLAIAATLMSYYSALSPVVGTIAAVVLGAQWLAAGLVLSAVGCCRAVLVDALGLAATQVAMVAGRKVWDVVALARWLPRVAATLVVPGWCERGGGGETHAFEKVGGVLVLVSQHQDMQNCHLLFIVDGYACVRLQPKNIERASPRSPRRRRSATIPVSDDGSPGPPQA